MAEAIHGTATGTKRRFLEAARRLAPIWLQGYESGTGRVEVSFSKNDGQIPEGDLFFLADTFGLELSEKAINEGPWIDYYFK